MKQSGAATDVGVDVGAGIVEIQRENASIGTIVPITAAIRTPTEAAWPVPQIIGG